RVCQVRKELGQVYPKVEVQYIKFQHNLDELQAAEKQLNEIGIDQFTHFWGDLGNYTERDPDFFEVLAPRKATGVPLCYWPHHSIVIKYNGDVIPCCLYRIGHQYTKENDPRVFGNVFETSVAEVWNNAKYRQARRMVNDPEAAMHESDVKDHFCYGCGAIYENTGPGGELNANNRAWEENYELGEDGRPIAKRKSTSGWKPVTQIGLPNGEMASI
ncbi:MAG TPA: SPASM domain-containing protein, partial [Phycisphaerae bacterium]|nr:SPASM domain-containing protein [Phycisphaerae bacterium]